MVAGQPLMRLLCDNMKDLKAMAASHAGERLQLSHNLLIDIVQQIRNKYTNGEKMPIEIEERIDEAFREMQNGRNWVRALANT